MSQTSDCPVNKAVLLSVDAKDGQQATFPMESNLDSLISSMLRGLNNQPTKPFNVTPAGDVKEMAAPFSKLNTPDAEIVFPTTSSSMIATTAAPTMAAAPAVVTTPIMSTPAAVVTPPVTEASIAPSTSMATPNQPSAAVMSPAPLVNNSEIKTEAFENTDKKCTPTYYITILILIGLLLFMLYLLAVKLEIIKPN